MTATRDTFSPPITSESQREIMAGSISSIGISHENFEGADEGKGPLKKANATTGSMMDSDGFEIALMEADDYNNLTLEEKILCGYYTAKPSYRESYPIA